jgi:hypothetical protein
MSKMGSRCPFGHLKHKLWPKERPGVKLAIWLPTTKSQESIRFPYVQATCDIPLESFQWGLQLCFKPHHDQRSAQEVICPQSRGSLGWCNFGTPSWESRDKMAIWMWPLWSGAKYTIRGKVVASPESRPWWVKWVWVARGLSQHPKGCRMSSNQLVVGFGCRTV